MHAHIFLSKIFISCDNLNIVLVDLLWNQIETPSSLYAINMYVR